ncbi:MAG TPA: hypothetical protein VHB69_02760 [Mycobacteriales bacterium]|nr:hypothetical protein [Mycobacteriales bacterium]
MASLLDRLAEHSPRSGDVSGDGSGDGDATGSVVMNVKYGGAPW